MSIIYSDYYHYSFCENRTMQIQIPSTQTLDYLKMDDALISTIFCERNRRNEAGGQARGRAGARAGGSGYSYFA